MDLFKKRIVVGVSVTPNVGLEAAQVDYETKTVLKYGIKPLEYNYNAGEIADCDIFKETLKELLEEMAIPKGSEIVLTLPPAIFKVTDYPASLDESQISGALEEELYEHYLFKNNEPCYSAVLLPNSSVQFNKVASIAVSKTMLLEIAMQVKEIGYKLVIVDSSVNTTLNALIYGERINVQPDVNWLLLIVENNCCRIISMNSRNYVDSFEEKISIGEVLGDEENYSTIIAAISPILKNLPSKYLYIISKTDVISAKILADKVSYPAPVIHQEMNCFTTESIFNLDPSVGSENIMNISLEVVGAAIAVSFKDEMNAHFNLFNKSLGDIYIQEQPPEVTINGRTFVLSNENLVKTLIVFLLLTIIPAMICLLMLSQAISAEKDKIADVQIKITQVSKFLKDNEDISTEMFDEGDEIRLGLGHNKNIYSYYTIVGTEIPKKLWLTHLKIGEKLTIEGQADNLESIYSFFRNIKDYNSNPELKLQKLGLAAESKTISVGEENFETDSIVNSLNADFYEFRISDEPPEENKQPNKVLEGLNLPSLGT